MIRVATSKLQEQEVKQFIRKLVLNFGQLKQVNWTQ